MNTINDFGYLFDLVPYPNPEHLPAGYSVWFWNVLTYFAKDKVAWGSVQYIKGGRFTTHAANVDPFYQRRGIYSGFVLPRLAHRFELITSSDYSTLSYGTLRAWVKAGAVLSSEPNSYYKLYKE